MAKLRSGFPQTPINLTLREEQISTILYCLEGYVQGNDDEELVEEMEDLIRDTEGTDAYNGFGTTMEDDGFYDTPDFTQLVVD